MHTNEPYGDARERVQQAEDKLGLRFQRKELLLHALVHRSFVLELRTHKWGAPGH